MTNLYKAKWEKRYNQQVSATEKALQEKRHANISQREVERVLEKERAAAAKAAQEASAAAAEAADALRDVAEAQDEREGGLKRALRSDINCCLIIARRFFLCDKREEQHIFSSIPAPQPIPDRLQRILLRATLRGQRTAHRNVTKSGNQYYEFIASEPLL